MGARGPKPPSSISVLPTPRQQRPMPLRGMSEKSRAVWMKIINAYPVDFFKPQHLGLLRMYCEADALAKIAQHEAGKVNFTDHNPKSLVNKPSHWLNIKSQAVSESMSLATKLGITKNNTTAARGEKGSNPKPKSKLMRAILQKNMKLQVIEDKQKQILQICIWKCVCACERGWGQSVAV